MGLLTLTIRHRVGDDLQEIAEGYQRAWNRLTTRVSTIDRIKNRERKLLGEPATNYREQSGWIGGVSGTEVTIGAHGWHYHRHVAVAFDRNLSEDEMRRVEVAISCHWYECVEAEMGEEHVPAWGIGVTIKQLHLEEYVSKLGLEISDVGRKSSRAGLTPWGLLEFSAQGDLGSWELLEEYTRVMRGKKCVQFSERLIDLWRKLGWRRDEREDGDLADESVGAELLLEIPPITWARLRKFGRISEVLVTAEDQGVDAARELIVSRAGWGDSEWGSGAMVEAEKARVVAARERFAIQSESGVRGIDRETRRSMARDERREMVRVLDSDLSEARKLRARVLVEIAKAARKKALEIEEARSLKEAARGMTPQAEIKQLTMW
ncbi:MAG: hypothetical protein KIT41_14290 [Pyrinomonadaceae bacterium]|nr:hypothetical protein [Pyrinomonadaceae bacterium]